MSNELKWTDYRLYFSDGSQDRVYATSEESAKRIGETVASRRDTELERVEQVTESA